MKKTAFTLIELLAVIIILATIALVSVPIVLNIIKDASFNSFKNYAIFILREAEQQKAKNNIIGLDTNDEIICDDFVFDKDKVYKDCKIRFNNNVAFISILGKESFNDIRCINSINDLYCYRLGNITVSYDSNGGTFGSGIGNSGNGYAIITYSIEDN